MLSEMCVYFVWQAKVLFDFASGGPGELTIYEGDIVTIIRQVQYLFIYKYTPG